MTTKENQKLEAFFSEDRECFKETVLKLLNNLEKEITFSLKIQKASIQLCDKVTFAIIAFRRSKPYFFVEFYNPEKLDNSRIVKTIAKTETLIINRVNILLPKEIDKELLNWIKESKAIAI